MPRRPQRRVKARKSEHMPARVLVEMARSASGETAPEARACVLGALFERNVDARARRFIASSRGICDATK